jgi:hypothetical protein
VSDAIQQRANEWTKQQLAIMPPDFQEVSEAWTMLVTTPSESTIFCQQIASWRAVCKASGMPNSLIIADCCDKLITALSVAVATAEAMEATDGRKRRKGA